MQIAASRGAAQVQARSCGEMDMRRNLGSGSIQFVPGGALGTTFPSH